MLPFILHFISFTKDIGQPSQCCCVTYSHFIFNCSGKRLIGLFNNWTRIFISFLFLKRHWTFLQDVRARRLRRLDLQNRGGSHKPSCSVVAAAAASNDHKSAALQAADDVSSNARDEAAAAAFGDVNAAAAANLNCSSEEEGNDLKVGRRNSIVIVCRT